MRIAGATDTGRIRTINQDAFAFFEQGEHDEILLAVADGLGGHRGGEVASRIAIDTLGEQIGKGAEDPPGRLMHAIERAHERILGAARMDRELGGMGTTLVCLLLRRHGRSFVAHVGDSRLYRFRSGRIDPLTHDHSLVAMLVREGLLSPEQARKDPRQNQILRALGIRDEIQIEISPLQLLPGDRYLLCSDGLHGLLEDDRIRRIVAAGDAPERTVRELIEAANRAGGIDNVTCLLADLTEPTPFPALLRGGLARIAGRLGTLLRRVGNA